MEIVKPDAELLWITPNAEKIIEQAGRICYMSDMRDSAEFIRMIKKRGHYSVLEHASASIKFICDRGVSHETVRHRHASFSQESTRFCNYSSKRFNGNIKVIEPLFKNTESKKIWADVVGVIEQAYMHLLDFGESPQTARSVLPTCLKTEFVMTCNFREWLHVFELRTTEDAHPQIKEIMDKALNLLNMACPAVF